MQHYHDDPLAGSGSHGSFIQNHILAFNFKTDERIHTKFHQYVVQLGVADFEIHRENVSKCLGEYPGAICSLHMF